MGDAKAARTERRLRAIADRRGRPDPGLTNESWPDGQRPGRLYITADGLWTSSIPNPIAAKLRPWIEVLQTPTRDEPPFDGLRGIDAPSVVRGFSYSETGHHYPSSSTVQDDGVLVDHFAADYGPHVCLPTIYLAFSLGAVVTTLGLTARLAAPAPPGARQIEAIILVQPAFRASKSLEQVLPAPLFWLIRQNEASDSPSGYVLIDRILSNLTVLVRTFHIPTYLLYWPGDEFIPYRDPLPDGRSTVESLLGATGVIMEPLPELLTFEDGRDDPFLRHSDIASHPAMLAALQSLLRQLINRPMAR